MTHVHIWFLIQQLSVRHLIPCQSNPSVHWNRHRSKVCPNYPHFHLNWVEEPPGQQMGFSDMQRQTQLDGMESREAWRQSGLFFKITPETDARNYSGNQRSFSAFVFNLINLTWQLENLVITDSINQYTNIKSPVCSLISVDFEMFEN